MATKPPGRPEKPREQEASRSGRNDGNSAAVGDAKRTETVKQSGEDLNELAIACRQLDIVAELIDLDLPVPLEEGGRIERVGGRVTEDPVLMDPRAVGAIVDDVLVEGRIPIAH